MGDFEKREYYVGRLEESAEGVRYQARPASGPKEDFEQAISAYSFEEAIALARRPRAPEGEPRMFTADEMKAAVRAVELAHQQPSSTIMGHIRSAESVAPESVEAIRKIVSAAFMELRIGR